MPSTDEEVKEEKAPEGDSEKQGAEAEKKPAAAPPEEEEQFVRQRLPDPKNKEIFGIADQLVGGSRIKVNCEDGRARLGRIPGKMKRRMWIRTGDLLIVKPWDFQDDKCDIKYRYMRTQSINLAKRGLLPDSVNIF